MASTTFELEEAWRTAIEKEKESRELYLRLGAMTENTAARSLFEFLAGEEAKHQRMLEDEFERTFMPDN
jgi:rubrerythrin